MLTPIMIRMRPGLKALLQERANRAGRTLSFYIADALEMHVVGLDKPNTKPQLSGARRWRSPGLPNGEALSEVTVRVPKPLKASLLELAAAGRRSLSSYASRVLEAHVAGREPASGS